MQLFGSGLMWGTPLTNSAGTAVANPTPLLFGVLQDCEVEVKFELKQLYGQNQFPVAVGRGKGSVNGKAKYAELFGGMLETIVFGQAASAGLTSAVYDTVGAAIPTTPFTITPTVPNSGTWAADLGVIAAATGRPMVRVASAPATGQYSVSTGVYTFAAADTALVVYISYRYTATSTVAKRSTVVSQPMGYSPTFRCDLYVPFNGEQLIITMNNCISDGLKMGFKNDDFSIPEFGFSAFADASGNVLTWATAE
jgi:hypothetical protein